MRWTRLSFSYLITYLALGGIGLLAAPDLALELLGAQGSYPEVLMRFLGAFMLSLSVVIVQIVRHRAEELYSTTLIVRTILLSTSVWLYARSGDRLFLVLAGIVALGMVLTSLGFVIDRSKR
jgi:hypothetical protein